MDFCHFLQFEGRGAADTLPPAKLSAAATLLRGLPGVEQVLLHTPSQTSDPFLNDGPPPVLAVQLYFSSITALEAALAPGTALLALADPVAWPELAAARASQQAMLVRRFPVPAPRPQCSESDSRCTYLVAYEGTADDVPGWLAYYLTHHPPIMARFPAIREIEIYTRLDWVGSLPFPRADVMQRNKVVFDSKEALTAALNSPVRQQMRDDFAAFPPFAGRNTHYPMTTIALALMATTAPAPMTTTAPAPMTTTAPAPMPATTALTPAPSRQTP